MVVIEKALGEIRESLDRLTVAVALAFFALSCASLGIWILVWRLW